MGSGEAMRQRAGALAIIVCILMSAAGSARTAEQQTLTIFAAGTLAVPIKALDEIFQREHPAVTVQPIFGGSVMIAKRLTELHQPADLIAVADYSVIPKYLFGQGGAPRYADWYAGFARNAATFVYTDNSKYAAEITPANWYQVLVRPGVEIGRSDPDTDPSGYQTVQMLTLAEKLYRFSRSRRQDPRQRAAHQHARHRNGADFGAPARPDRLSRDLPFRCGSAPVPPSRPAGEIDLSDANEAAFYANGVAHTKNGDLAAKPIVYAATIPRNAEHRDLAEAYLRLLLGPDGQEVMARNGFRPVAPAYAANMDEVPAPLRAQLTPWPGS